MDGDQIDSMSATWRVVRNWALQRLESHQRDLETPGLDAHKTEQARGAIRDLRVLLKLPEPSRVDPAHSADAGQYNE